MEIKIFSLFPEMFEGPLGSSLIGKAQEKDILHIDVINFREYSTNKHKSVDDYPFGGGAGMVLQPEPIVSALRDNLDLDAPDTEVILMSPQGKPFTQEAACALAQKKQLAFVCGHYEGFDERIFNWVDEKLSIGDYVLTGGEMPALIIMDAVSRFIPGVLGKLASAEEDSFSTGMLEYPQYTRPVDFEGLVVPEVLRNGNHALIATWRRKKSLKATYRLRPDLLSQEVIDAIHGKVPRDMKKAEKKFYAEVREELAQEDNEGE